MSFKSPYRSLFPSWRMQRDQAMGNLGATYIDKVLGYGPIAYWPLYETTGTTAVCLVNPAQNGTYARNVTMMGTGDGIGDGNTAPVFDSINDYMAMFSAAFDAVFDGDEGTCMVWGYVSDWTDNADRYLAQIYDDGSNNYTLRKKSDPAGANEIRYFVQVGGAGGGLNDGTLTGSVLMDCYLFTWSDVANETELFLNGVSVGTVALANAWSGGGLSATNTLLGAGGSGPVVDALNGRLAHCAVWDSVLPQVTITELATV